MVSKYFVLVCVLLQGLVAVASENSKAGLNRSNEALRRSQGSLSKSQEILASRERNTAASLYYASPCSRRLSDVKRDMMPISHHEFRSDCP